MPSWSATRLVRRSLDGVTAMWSEPGDARALAICRVILFAKAFEELKPASFERLVQLGATTWKPHSYFVFMQPPEGETARVLVGVYLALSCLAALGVGYRVTAVATAVLSLYLHGIMQNYGKFIHGHHLFSVALVILSASRAADAWSVDALVKWLRGGRKGSPLALVPLSAEYRWPLLFVGSTVFVMYGAAGLSKLMITGPSWALSDSFRQMLLESQFTGTPPTHLGVWLADHPALCQGLALLALMTEVCSWLGLLNRSLYWVFACAVMGLQFGIWVLMGVTFGTLPTIFSFYVPWNFLLSRADPWLERFQSRLFSRRPAPS